MIQSLVKFQAKDFVEHQQTATSEIPYKNQKRITK